MKYEMNANQKAMGGIGMFLAFVIVAIGAIYADVMFIQLMWAVFPPGIMQVGAIAGALLTSISVLVLMLGKSYWFRPGQQLVFAWIFTFLEVACEIANVLLATQVAEHNVSGVMTAWQMLSPATPFVAVIGWIVLVMLDSSTKMRHAHMEMEEQKEMGQLQYEVQVHQAHMGIKQQHLSQVSEQLNTVINSPAVQAQIAQHAQRMVAKVLTDVSGISAFNSGDVSLPKIVDSSLAQASMSQIAPAPQAPEPKTEPLEDKKKVASSGTSGNGSQDGNVPVAPSVGQPATQTQLPNSSRRSKKQGN